ncbi:MAG: DUF4258 domain-containing protein [Candidatus ainarchaeum sp.]|nr:DUF4258 domain-containing protein [Candidatus ainarchaeum sp.]
MNGKNLREKLSEIAHYAVVFTNHAEFRLAKRQIEKEIVVNHLRNPAALELAEKIFAEKASAKHFPKAFLFGEKAFEKYKLWSVPFKKIAYVYVIVINHLEQKIVVITVIKQRLDWQRKVERNV